MVYSKRWDLRPDTFGGIKDTQGGTQEPWTLLKLESKPKIVGLTPEGTCQRWDLNPKIFTRLNKKIRKWAFSEEPENQNLEFQKNI